MQRLIYRPAEVGNSRSVASGYIWALHRLRITAVNQSAPAQATPVSPVVLGMRAPSAEAEAAGR